MNSVAELRISGHTDDQCVDGIWQWFRYIRICSLSLKWVLIITTIQHQAFKASHISRSNIFAFDQTSHKRTYQTHQTTTTHKHQSKWDSPPLQTPPPLTFASARTAASRPSDRKSSKLSRATTTMSTLPLTPSTAHTTTPSNLLARDLPDPKGIGGDGLIAFRE